MRRLQVFVGSLLLGGAVGVVGGAGTFFAGLVGGLGLGTILGAFVPDDE